MFIYSFYFLFFIFTVTEDELQRLYRKFKRIDTDGYIRMIFKFIVLINSSNTFKKI